MKYETQVFEDEKWVSKPACPICLRADCPGHCGRCGRELVWHPGHKAASCPQCTTRIGRW